MRGIKAPQAPPRSARPPPRAGAFATFQAIENADVFGWHKVRSTEVAAPTRRSGTARLIPQTATDPFRPIPTVTRNAVTGGKARVSGLPRHPVLTAACAIRAWRIGHERCVVPPVRHAGDCPSAPPALGTRRIKLHE